jgi:hypothetical protein
MESSTGDEWTMNRNSKRMVGKYKVRLKNYEQKQNSEECTL